MIKQLNLKMIFIGIIDVKKKIMIYIAVPNKVIIVS